MYNELWCKGGEISFIKKMIIEGKKYRKQIDLFSTLVSKKENVGKIKQFLQSLDCKDVKTISMGQGNKVSRIMVWRY